MRAVLFPGQGAQSKGMGKDLFPLYPLLTRAASEILGYSIEKLCLEDPEGQLRYTQFTQPALYVVNAFGYMRRKREGAVEAQADYFAGHSLGEYNALLAAEAFDFESGLRLVRKRGELMGKASGGSMAAVIANAQKIREVLDQNELQEIDLANYNTPTQTVISGKTDAIGRAEKIFRDLKIRCVVLNVTAPFHSRYMQPAQQEFAEFTKQIRFFPLKTPVISNVTARPHEDGQVAQLLISQITSPVRWHDSIRYLLLQRDMQFTEIGSNIFTNMVNEISKAESVLKLEASA